MRSAASALDESSPPRQLGAAKFKGEIAGAAPKSSSQRHVVGRGERLRLKSVAK